MLNIALIHSNVRHKAVADNTRHLLSLNRKAAQAGHKIIVNTEMGLSGYSFSSVEDLTPHALAMDSYPVRALCSIACEFKVFICVGLALKDPGTTIFYNAALIIGQDGVPVCRYHKVNAESRWACSGDPCQNNVFNTPWGKVGVVICSDTYHGLLIRQTALKGADLILVPANWSPSGLDPRELWEIRARENGIYLAVCNRTGTDLTMDCKNALSGVFSPEGNAIVCRTHPDAMVISAEIPLKNGQILSQRKAILAQRKVEHYSPIYLDMRYSANNAQALTDWYGLNPPGPLSITAVTAIDGTDRMSAPFTCDDVMLEVTRQIKKIRGDQFKAFGLLIFPQILGSRAEIETLMSHLASSIRSKTHLAVCLSRIAESDTREILCLCPGGAVVRHSQDGNGNGLGPTGLSIVDTGPARIGICLPEDLQHPETGIAHAKLGCDLLITSTDRVAPGDRRVMAGRSLDKVAVAGAAQDCAFICAPPKGHDRFQDALVHWPETLSEPTTDTVFFHVNMNLDTTRLREKIFQDRLDYHILLSDCGDQ